MWDDINEIMTGIHYMNAYGPRYYSVSELPEGEDSQVYFVHDSEVDVSIYCWLDGDWRRIYGNQRK